MLAEQRSTRADEEVSSGTTGHLESVQVDARNMIIEKTGHLGAPIVGIGEDFIFGFDPKKMERLLKNRSP